MKRFGIMLAGVALLGGVAMARGEVKQEPVKIEAKQVTITKPGKAQLRILADGITLSIDGLPWSDVDTGAKRSHMDSSANGTTKSITFEGNAHYTLRRDGLAVLQVNAESITVMFEPPVTPAETVPPAATTAPGGETTEKADDKTEK